jgi:aminoglycoside phosphotransferase (APT) family kinase protein
MLLLEAIDGIMVWDLVDPRREYYSESNALAALRRFGEMQGQIHRLTLECPTQPRVRLYDLIGEEMIDDPRFHEIIVWLKDHEIAHRDRVFVHGDYNTANVILRDGIISGVIDWEFAGSGWKEYDLAWTLRARMSFLNSQREREAFLQGYYQYNSCDADALRWCEVMNYLHDAYWSLEVNLAYTDFSTAQALKLIS